MDDKKTELEDGLYRVDAGGVCAGFEVKGGKVIACAPCLADGEGGVDPFWRGKAERVERAGE